MSDPSGEKCGSVSTPGVAVRRRAEPPLRPTTHRSPAYSKATRSLLTAGWRRRRVPWALRVAAQPNAAAMIARCLVNMKPLGAGFADDGANSVLLRATRGEP